MEKLLRSRSEVVWRALLLVPLAFLAAPHGASGQVSFTDVTAFAGLEYTQFTPPPQPGCLSGVLWTCELQYMSGGAAVADVDGDGWPDLYVTRLDAPDRLFRNLGDGRFEDVTAAAGLAGFDLQSNGAGFGDVDNDGDPDLYVTTVGEATDPANARYYLFINDGNGQFSEQAVARGAHVPSAENRSGYSVAFGDYDRDGWLDVHLTEWYPEDRADGFLGHGRLLRNRGAAAPGHFEDTTAAAGVAMDRSAECLAGTGPCRTLGFASSFTDLDNDGWPDLAVAGDFGTSRLFWNDGDGTFTEGTVAAGVGTDENGMGSTLGDFDGDGRLDWFVTSIFDSADTCATSLCHWGATGNRLFRNLGNRQFADVTDAADVRDGQWGWGTGFFDFDNDGDLDLAMTNGVAFPWTEDDDPFETDPIRFWENQGAGPMPEVAGALGAADTGSGKGFLTFDYDGDGDLDVFVVNNVTGGLLYRNDGGDENDWLRIEIRGVDSNRDGLGTFLVVGRAAGGPSQVRQIGTGSHFLGQSENTAHFGLGAAGGGPVDRIFAVFPSGRLLGLTDVAPNQTLVLHEPPAWSCGLLGIEPLLLLAWVRAVRRRPDGNPAELR